jgi:acyl-CoA synthetase (AMP-forming)/AMP-acid ligase II
MIFKSPYPDVEIPEVPLTEHLIEQMKAYGDKTALVDGPSGRAYTFNQLIGAIRRVAASLQQRGFQKGDVFAIYSPNLPEYTIAFHGVSLAGGIVTTINPLYTADELAQQLIDAGAKYLVTISLFLENAQKAAEKANIQEIFTFDPVADVSPFMALLQSEGEVTPVAINPKEDLVVLPYSSGTTGLPKGVMLTHYNIVANMVQCEGITSFQLVSEKDTVLGLLPFFHIYGMVVIMNMSLAQGATVVTIPRFDPELFLTLIQKHKVTRINLVPPVLLLLAKHPVVDKFDLSSLEEVTSGAAPLGEDLAEAVVKRVGCNVLQGYGLTETSPVTHVNFNPPDNVKRASVGKSIPNTECLIVDVESGEPVGTNANGEIWIRGPQVMQGYLNRPDATAATIDDEGWLHTGDIGYVDDDGDFYIVDRLKELIKYKGFQVAPAELEGLMLSHPAIADVAVIPSPDEEAGEVPKAFVVLNQEATADEIMAWVADQVSPHKKIRRLEFVDQIPKSLSGKILRRVLVDQERGKLAGN